MESANGITRAAGRRRNAAFQEKVFTVVRAAGWRTSGADA